MLRHGPSDCRPNELSIRLFNGPAQREPVSQGATDWNEPRHTAESLSTHFLHRRTTILKIAAAGISKPIETISNEIKSFPNDMMPNEKTQIVSY